MESLLRWVYPSLTSKNLSIRMSTHPRQKPYLAQIQNSFCNCIVGILQQDKEYSAPQQSMFVNMEETAMFYESKMSRIVHTTGSNAVAICGSPRASCSSIYCIRCLTVCISAASDSMARRFRYLLYLNVNPADILKEIYTTSYLKGCMAAGHAYE